jgi:hypothetical protein
MSYSVEIQDPETGEALETQQPHTIKGGTYCLGGTTRLELNITYNYSAFFQRPDVLGATDEEKQLHDKDWISDHTGLNRLVDLTVVEAIPLVSSAIRVLKNEHLDKDGKPYDMVTKYSEETQADIDFLRLKYARAIKADKHEEADQILEKLDFLEKYCTRAIGYWAPTEANTKAALMNLLNLLMLAPDYGVIKIY